MPRWLDVRELPSKGVTVPNRFAITAVACRKFLRETKLDIRIKEILKYFHTHDFAKLRQRGGHCDTD